MAPLSVLFPSEEKPRVEQFFAVQLPAQTALCRNRAELRKLLIHEFCHYFFAAAELVTEYYPETRQLLDIIFVPAQPERPDAATLANPDQWLGPADARKLLQSETSCLPTINETARALSRTSCPRSCGPEPYTGPVRLLDDVVAHTKALLKRYRDGEGIAHQVTGERLVLLYSPESFEP
jgi:hypothetical protein